jgi:hypothetical protein
MIRTLKQARSTGHTNEIWRYLDPRQLFPKEVLSSAEKIAASPPVNVDLSTHFRLPHFVRFTAPPFQLRYKSTDWDYPDYAVHRLDTPTGLFFNVLVGGHQRRFHEWHFSGLQVNR